MSDRCSNAPRYSIPLKLGITFLILLAPFAAAQAYVGPGAGLSLLSALWGLLCAIGAAFLFVILWPIRRMRRKRREARQANAPQKAESAEAHREENSSSSASDQRSE